MHGRENMGKFVFEPAEREPIGSVLYEEHLKLTAKSRIAPFAGYLMPLWYSSIGAEHTAVRQTAGLFDCTHMGALEVAGPDAAGFLDTVTTNKIDSLEVGKARYSYILDAAGNILDDIIIYHTGPDKYMVVVNASNEPKIKAWFDALLKDQAIIDAQSIDRKLQHKPSIRDMRDTNSGSECRVDIALQGPNSTEIILSLATNDLAEQISEMKSFRLLEVRLGDIECLICRTGYTGAIACFELFVHPQEAAKLWSMLLTEGEQFGLLPCGLGARDSLRIEAGLPLYGHELDGPFNISPFEAGYGWAVKLQKEFFIGKAAMQKNSESYDMEVARIEFPGTKGIRPVRQNDGILNSNGECVGWVLSCAGAGESQIALAYVDRNAATENNAVSVYYLARSQGQIAQGRKQSVKKEEVLKADLAGKILSRFAKF